MTGHETRVRDDDAIGFLELLVEHLTTAETDVELAEATEKTDDQYGTAVNAADITETHDTGGWNKVSFWMPGARSGRFMICVSRARVIRPSRAASA